MEVMEVAEAELMEDFVSKKCCKRTLRTVLYNFRDFRDFHGLR